MRIITALAMTVFLTACSSQEAEKVEVAKTADVAPVEVKAAAIEKPMTSKEAIKFEILEKEMTNSDMQELIGVKFRIDNNSGRELTGVKGTIVFFDKFNDEIIQLNFSDDTLDMPVKGWTEAWLDFPYNPYISGDVKFMETDLEDMTYEFRSHTILFADGSTL